MCINYKIVIIVKLSIKKKRKSPGMMCLGLPPANKKQIKRVVKFHFDWIMKFLSPALFLFFILLNCTMLGF